MVAVILTDNHLPFCAMPIPDIAVITSFTFFLSVLYCTQGDADTGILYYNLFGNKNTDRK